MSGLGQVGRSFEELDGRSWFDFFSAEYHELVESRLRTLRHGRPTQPLQHEIIRLDGEWRLVELGGSAGIVVAQR